jgi:hypothetical protein
MSAQNVMEVVEAVRHLTPAEQREVLARLWPEQALASGDKIWQSVRLGESARIVAYVPEQEQYLAGLRDLLTRGALARRESDADGTYELYGPDRTYYVTLTPEREFAALLSSWEPDRQPREITLQDA